MESPNGFPRTVFLALAFGVLAYGALLVLQPFVVGMLWAGIMTHATWRPYKRLTSMLGGRQTPSALVMVFLLMLALVLPLLWITGAVTTELGGIFEDVTRHWKDGEVHLPEFLSRVPWLEDWVRALLSRLTSGEAGLFEDRLTGWLSDWRSELLAVAGGVGRNAMKFAIALLAAFFFYRDGERVLRQITQVARRFLNGRVDSYLDIISRTVRAVVLGIIVTAFAQGALAALGYWVAGVESPVVLGVLTAFVALIPFGAAIVWGSVGVWLLFSANPWAGVILLAWGALAVSWIDNLIRPYVISTATELHFLWVFFGVLGGLAAFGLVGLFVGPALLAVLAAVWKEWLQGEDNESDGPVRNSR